MNIILLDYIAIIDMFTEYFLGSWEFIYQLLYFELLFRLPISNYSYQVNIV